MTIKLIFAEKAFGKMRKPILYLDGDITETEADDRCEELDKLGGWKHFWMDVEFGGDICEHDWDSMLGPNDERLKKCANCNKMEYR